MPRPTTLPALLDEAIIDPVLAASHTDRVTANRREAWIANVAQNYARLDPQGSRGDQGVAPCPICATMSSARRHAKAIAKTA